MERRTNRIIRVSTCNECPYVEWNYYTCEKVSEYINNKNHFMCVEKHVHNKTLPEDKCPLEKAPANAFAFLDDESEDIYTGTEGELIVFKTRE